MTTDVVKKDFDYVSSATKEDAGYVAEAMNLADEHYDEFRELSSEHMSELLTDVDYSTYKMFESLASDYQSASEEVRKGIDIACSALTGWYFTSIAKAIVEKFKKEGV